MSKIFEYTFDIYLECLKKCYATKVQHLLPQVEDFPAEFSTNISKGNLEEILRFGMNQSDSFITSICYRIVAIHNIQNSRRYNTNLDVNATYKHTANSIMSIPLNSTISSIGSQGFLSIPLFKFDDDLDNFEFIRLHIWSSKLNEYIDQKTRDSFSIHSHSFDAQSWIITGNLINQDFEIIRDSDEPNSSLFKIQYNKTLNEVNQHQSIAINTNKQIKIVETDNSTFSVNDTYKIAKGEFHKSVQSDELETCATFFTFYLTNEKLVQSEVTGPTDLRESTINRKMYIDPSDLIKDISDSIH